ncbi:hypothetical protein VTK56DRAFT_8214 [Thermocarpiscus australiensis]
MWTHKQPRPRSPASNRRDSTSPETWSRAPADSTPTVLFLLNPTSATEFKYRDFTVERLKNGTLPWDPADLFQPQTCRFPDPFWYRITSAKFHSIHSFPFTPHFYTAQTDSNWHTAFSFTGPGSTAHSIVPQLNLSSLFYIAPSPSIPSYVFPPLSHSHFTLFACHGTPRPPRPL